MIFLISFRMQIGELLHLIVAIAQIKTLIGLGTDQLKFEVQNKIPCNLDLFLLIW